MTLRLIFALLLLVLRMSAAEQVPSHREIDPIRIQLGPDGEMLTIAMDRKGNLLAGVKFHLNGDKSRDAYGIKRVGVDGRVQDTWVMTGELIPKMIHGCDDGEVYVAGNGYVAAFDETGREIRRTDVDKLLGYKALASGLYVTDKHVFAAFGSGGSLRATEEFWRFDRDLTGGRQIIGRQYGCCGHIDLEVIGSRLLVAENSRHRVNIFDLNGGKLNFWGARDRVGIEGFAACCNPCNLDVDAQGTVYTFESGIGRVKRYTADGKYLGLVGYVDTTKFDQGSRLAAQSCYIPSEVSPDGRRIYVMDVRQHFIRVLERSE